ncbi:MAG: sensor histidine kinase [Parachlamydiaceae bacterium]
MYKSIEPESNFFKAIVKNISEEVCVVRVKDSLIVYANLKFEKMFGYESGELNGKSTIEVVNFGDGKEGKSQRAEQIVARLSEPGEGKHEVQSIKKDGTIFWCLATASQFNHPDHGIVLVIVYENINNRNYLDTQLPSAEPKDLPGDIHFFEAQRIARLGMLTVDCVSHKSTSSNEKFNCRIVSSDGVAKVCMRTGENFSAAAKSVDEGSCIETALRKLTADIQNAQEIERARIAREINNEIGQSLTVLKMDLCDLKNNLSSGSTVVTGKIMDIVDSVNILIKSVRKTSSDLCPTILEDLGLEPAVEWLVNDFRSRTGKTVNFELDLDGVEVNREISTALFRIMQEALIHILFHSCSRSIDLSLHKSKNYLLLRLRDYHSEESMFDQLINENKLGVLDMKERALNIGANFFIENDGGIILKVDVPLKGMLSI